MENYDFSQIPLWNGEPSSFEILTDKVSGRIPVTRVESWQGFTGLLEAEFFNRSKTQLVFRGHRRFDWGLQPTLARIPESGIINRELANRQLEHFKKAVRGRLSDAELVHEEQEDELWSVGQHHGLQTPLLDWTYSPYVALFFAFSKADSEQEDDNPYRAIYVLNKSFVSDDDLCPAIRMFEPRKDNHGRLVNQAGLFTFSPYDSTIEDRLTEVLSADRDEEHLPEEFVQDVEALKNAAEDEQAAIIAKYICKIYIRNEDREGCMRHLRRMNVHHASLFPDLIGASEYCNLVVAEEQREYEIELAEAEQAAKAKKLSATAQHQAKSTYDIDDEQALFFAQSLEEHASQKVEPGRIQVIAEHLAKGVQPLLVVDWSKRESAIAKLRSFIRISLRKYGYPSDGWESVSEAILEHLKPREELQPEHNPEPTC